jgi:predicted house-cleaning noncanonical NTP pyrophosphatase (MazG superfamily)
MTKTKKKFHNKLVRDKILQIIEEAGHGHEARTLSEEEFRKKLKEKLVEEAQELLKAPSEELLNELSDVLQLVRSVAENEGIEFDEVEEKRKKKKKERGAFEKRIFLIWSTKQKNESSNS